MTRISDHDYEVMKIVPRVLADLLALHGWKIDVVWDRIIDEDGEPGTRCMGKCDTDPLRQCAWICVDYAEHDDLEEIVHTLRHEFIHVLHTDFNCIMTTAGQFVPDDGRMDVVHESYRQAMERFVTQMQRVMEHGLKGGSIKQIIAEARRRYRGGAHP